MNYYEVTRFLKECESYGSILGLENMKNLLKELGNPQKKLKFVHIAGTNGKGSTAAFITYGLAAAGYRVGRYISPAVFGYEEKFQIFTSGEGDKLGKISSISITKEDLAEEVARIKEACLKLVLEGKTHPTIFEVETALAMLYFTKYQCEPVVLEVGLGGRLDATNIIDTTECAVITSISMDHMAFLGNTLSEIAQEKAGIIKKGVPVVSYEQKVEAVRVITQRAKELSAELFIADFSMIKISNYTMEGATFSYGERKNLMIRLLGIHQVKNAVVALLALEVLGKRGYAVSESQIKEGFYQTLWEGRMEPVSYEPLFLLDGAHNEDAAKNLAENIRHYFYGKRIIFILGVLADKEYEAILSHTVHLAERVYTVTPQNHRALSSTELAKAGEKYNTHIIDAKTASNAVTLAFKEAGREDIIIAFGSLSYLQDIRQEVNRRL